MSVVLFSGVDAYTFRMCFVILSEYVWLYVRNVFGYASSMCSVLLSTCFGFYLLVGTQLKKACFACNCSLYLSCDSRNKQTRTHTQNLISHMLNVLDWTTEGSTTLGTKLIKFMLHKCCLHPEQILGPGAARMLRQVYRRPKLSFYSARLPDQCLSNPPNSGNHPLIGIMPSLP